LKPEEQKSAYSNPHDNIERDNAMTYASINPADGKLLKKFYEINDKEF
jgi:hypothetical protein